MAASLVNIQPVNKTNMQIDMEARISEPHVLLSSQSGNIPRRGATRVACVQYPDRGPRISPTRY
jgi:hypothetical protein